MAEVTCPRTAGLLAQRVAGRRRRHRAGSPDPAPLDHGKDAHGRTLR